MTKIDGKKAPRKLPESAKKFWLSVHRAYELEAHHEQLLTAACFQLSRAIEARELLEADGLTVRDRFDQLREHPAVGIERSSSLAFQRLVREMNLDIDPAAEVRGPSRPGTAGRR